ncbi:MAG: DUF808 domain-containing protein, partial [Ramlibacter sp.]
GSILAHGVGPLHQAVEQLAQSLGGAMGSVLSMLADAVVGILAGALVLGTVTLAQRLRGTRAGA